MQTNSSSFMFCITSPLIVLELPSELQDYTLCNWETEDNAGSYYSERIPPEPAGFTATALLLGGVCRCSTSKVCSGQKQASSSCAWKLFWLYFKEKLQFSISSVLFSASVQLSWFILLIVPQRDLWLLCLRRSHLFWLISLIIIAKPCPCFIYRW